MKTEIATSTEASFIEEALKTIRSNPDYLVLSRMVPLPYMDENAIAERPKRKTSTIAILDTETTGLDSKIDKIIEIAILLIEIETDTGNFIRLISEYDKYEDPGFKLELRTTELTGITDLMVGGQAFNETEISKLLMSADLIIAHKAEFDRNFFESRFPKLNNFAWGCSLKQIDWSELGMGSGKLEFLAYKTGFFFDAHRALLDCHALGRVLISTKIASGETALLSLLNKKNDCDYLVHATGSSFDSKDILKNNNYKWNGDSKVWSRIMSQAELENELEWLFINVFKRKKSNIQIDVITANGRFSNKPPEGSVTTEWVALS